MTDAKVQTVPDNYLANWDRIKAMDVSSECLPSEEGVRPGNEGIIIRDRLILRRLSAAL